jgi:NAD+ kinase
MADPRDPRAINAIRHVGIVYQEHAPKAVTLAQTLLARLRAEGLDTWMAPAARVSEVKDLPRGADVILVLGGDGTILSVARQCAPEGTPLIGINFGRVGFLTELEPGEVDEQLGLYLGGDFWVDERAMLRAEVDVAGQRHDLLALNDIVLVRGAEPRVVRIRVWVDGYLYNTTVADGVIVSTATGSTAYNLAAGGPILHPQVRSAVLTPVAPHLASDRSLVLEPDAAIALEVLAGSGGAMLSADGQINLNVPDGTQVSVTTNGSVTRFLRRRPPTHFYKVLSAKLKESL